MILGDLGADVIKVEKPGTGDDTRGWGPPFNEDGQSAYFLSINRNKLSVALDYDDPPDRASLLALIEDADVVVDNFRPGTLERRGIDPGALLEENPELIWCTITGFGQESDRAGYDLVVQAEGGWMSITGDPDGEPTKIGVALADIIAGKDAAISILAALVRRSSAREAIPSEERRLHVSLIASATAALINVAQNSLVTGREARRWGNQHPNLVPYQLFHAADRPMIVAVGNDAQWRACSVALGLYDLSTDGALATNAGRLEQRDRIIAAMADRLRGEPALHWIERLDAVGVPCGVVKSVLEAVKEAGASPLTGIPPSVPGTIRHPPPLLDADGPEIRRRGWKVFRD